MKDLKLEKLKAEFLDLCQNGDISAPDSCQKIVLSAYEQAYLLGEMNQMQKRLDELELTYGEES